jgi:hypothetical protein
MGFTVLSVLVTTMEGNPPAKQVLGNDLDIYKKQKSDLHLGNLTSSPLTHMNAYTHTNTQNLLMRRNLYVR